MSPKQGRKGKKKMPKLELIHQRPNGDLIYIHDNGVSNLGRPLTMKKLIEQVENSDLSAPKKKNLLSLINSEFPSGKTVEVKTGTSPKQKEKKEVLPLEYFSAEHRRQKIGYRVTYRGQIYQKVRGGWQVVG